MGETPLWEVFIRPRNGLAHKHVGSLHAADAVMAVTDPAKGSRGGMTAFLVDKDTKGLSIPSVFNTIGEYAPYAVFFDNVELSDDQVLGEVGNGFGPMQNRLGVRRMEIACRALGYARRCMDYMLKQANERKTFGALLAERQQVQWWLADSWQEMEMVRWITIRRPSGPKRASSRSPP